MKHPLFNSPFGLSSNVRYKFGGRPKVAAAPSLPEPLPATSIISEQAQEAGRTERRRIKGLKGKRGTIFAGRRDLAPAVTSKAGLKTTFG